MRHLTIALAALAITACTPKYPACDKDEHCKQGEFCVNKLCQQCRNDGDCGPGKLCQKGRCEEGCRTTADCPDGKACKDGKCAPCAADADCGEGGRCRAGKCLRPGQCASSADCPPNHECQDGRCVAPPKAAAPPACSVETVYFDFNESVLTVEASSKLQANARCIKEAKGRTLRLEGHCDPRGTDEYNIALGDQRARSVQRYLGRLGIETSRLRVVSKGKLEATGKDESGWARDRKVVFIWE